MPKITITLKLPEGIDTWLADEGEPQYRSAREQAAYLCAKYLTECYKRTLQPRQKERLHVD